MERRHLLDFGVLTSTTSAETTVAYPLGGAPDDRRRLAARLWLVAAFILMVASGWLAITLLELGGGDTTSAKLAHPELVVLTDQGGTTAAYKVEYFEFSRTTPGATAFGPPEDDLPLGARKVTFTFHGQIPGATLNWVVLLNDDAKMTDAIAVVARGLVQETAPGPSFVSSCDSLDTLAPAQVLSGQQSLDQDGNATVSFVGGVSKTIHYPQQEYRTAVDVISVLPASPTSPTGGECTMDLLGWDQVAGKRWRTPTLTNGIVDVGRVSAGSYVESANPPNRDPRTLQWQLQGPADVTYTLYSTTGQGQRERRFFFAGVAASFAVTMLAEVLKGLLEALALTRPRRTPAASVHQQPRAPTSPAGDLRPVPASIVGGHSSAHEPSRLTTWLVAAVAIATGAIAVARMRHRDSSESPPHDRR